MSPLFPNLQPGSLTTVFCLKIKVWLVLFISLSLVSLGFNRSAIADKTKNSADYIFGVLPYLPPVRLEALYASIVMHMNQHSDRPIIFQTASSYERFMQQLESERYDIAFIQPFDYVRIASPLGYIPLVTRQEKLVGTIVVKSDSQLQSIKQLKGRVLAMPPRVAAVSYLIKLSLMDAGLNPESDLTIHYVKNQASCLMQVWLDEADACGTALLPMRHFEAKMKLKLKVLKHSQAIPHTLIVAHPRVPLEQREKLTKALLNIQLPASISPFFQKDSHTLPFKRVTNSDYDEVRALIENFRKISQDDKE